MGDIYFPFWLIVRFIHIVGYRFGMFVLPLLSLGKAKVDDEGMLNWYVIQRNKNLKIVVSMIIGSVIGWIFLLSVALCVNFLRNF